MQPRRSALRNSPRYSVRPDWSGLEPRYTVAPTTPRFVNPPVTPHQSASSALFMAPDYTPPGPPPMMWTQANGTPRFPVPSTVAYPSPPQEADEIDDDPTLPCTTPSHAEWRYKSGTLAWTPKSRRSGLPVNADPPVFNLSTSLFAPTPVRPAQSLRGSPWNPPQPVPNLPPTPPIEVTVHPSLAANANSQHLPAIIWDLIHLPATAKRRSRHSSVQLELNTIATYPKTTKMEIWCDHPAVESWMRLWGPIVVHKKRKLTIEDVMDEIYKYFRTPLRRSEIDGVIAENPEHEDDLHRAAFSRVSASYALWDYERSLGLMRVDTLGQDRMYGGLIPMGPPEENKFMLRLASLQPSW